MSTLSLVVLIVGITLIFDFINGFHDSANSIATIVATIYYVASRGLPFLITHAVVSGLLYGLCVYLVMYGIVMRFSAIHSTLYPWQYPWAVLIPNVLIHMLGIGLTIALIVRKFSK